MTHIVVFASGSGTGFQSIIDAINRGQIKHAQITGLIAGRKGIKAIDRAKKQGIPVYVINKRLYTGASEFTRKLREILQKLEPDLIVLAGYLQKIPPEIVQSYQGKIINIHPSLLPRYGGKGFYGPHVHKAVIENGDTVTGCTVHYVTENYDEGAIIEQRQVAVKEDDTPETLAERVKKEEHRLLPNVIQKLIHSNQ